MFRITIFAARRVFPPLLITPANASKPFMKLTGPDAIPPPLSVSLLPRNVEKFVPVPEPHLKSIPSVRVSFMIDSMSSLTELMNHDQLFGTSTSSWRKIVTPFSFPISTVSFSHSTASKGDFFPSVKYRSKVRPFPSPLAVFSAAASVAGDFPFNACFTVAIRPSALLGRPHSRGGNPFILLLCVPQRCHASLQRLG